MSAKAACMHRNFAGFIAFLSEKACKGTAFFSITQEKSQKNAKIFGYLRKL
jgi:hypothetical protein